MDRHSPRNPCRIGARYGATDLDRLARATDSHSLCALCSELQPPSGPSARLLNHPPDQAMTSSRLPAVVLLCCSSLMLLPSRCLVAAWCRGPDDDFCPEAGHPSRYTCGKSYDCKLAPGGGITHDPNESIGWECTCQLKGGIIAAIVLSCVAFTIGVCVVGLFLRNRRRKQRQAAIDALAMELIASQRVVAPARVPHLVAAIPDKQPQRNAAGSANGGPFRSQYNYPPSIAHLQPPAQTPAAGAGASGGLMIPQPPLYVQAGGLAVAAVAVSGASAGVVVRFCPSCGTSLPPWTGANPFCASCGTRRPEAAGAAAFVQSPPHIVQLPQQPDGLDNTAEGQPSAPPPPFAAYAQPAQFAGAAPGGAPMGLQYEGEGQAPPQYGISYGVPQQ